MNTPLVSICIPTYNRPHLLLEAVRSCQRQTHTNWECIITDNSEKTSDLAPIFASDFNDSRVRYVHNGGNIGFHDSANKGVAMARGKYVKLLMDDDLIDHGFLARMVAVMKREHSAGAVMAPMRIIDGAGHRITPKFYGVRTMKLRYRYMDHDGLVPCKQLLLDFLTRDYPCCIHSGILFRAEALKVALPFGPGGFAGDLYTCMKVATKWNFYYIDEPLSSWRLTEECHTARLHRDGMPVEEFFNILKKIWPDIGGGMFIGEQFWSVWDDALFFCTCRALALNGMAAWRARRPSILWNTLKIVKREDFFWPRHLLGFIPWAIRQALPQRAQPEPRREV